MTFCTALCFFFPWTRRDRGRRSFSPLQRHHLPPHLHKSWHDSRLSSATMIKIRYGSPAGSWGDCIEAAWDALPCLQDWTEVG
jgi:hypothetical protein